MKRISMFFVLFLMALCCTLTVSASGYAIHSVTIRGNAVQVSVTAQSNCALWGAVYEESGKMFAANSANVSGAADAQTVTLSFGNIPADAYAKAVLLEKDTFRPLCVPDDNSPVYTDDVYAILYADGTMVFQHGDTPQPGREVKGSYAVDMAESYEWAGLVPWRDVVDSIERVEFADKIRPKSTAYWFYECAKLTEISALNNLDTSDVTDMSYMFAGCASLASLDVSGFDTANVTAMRQMFSSCKSLTALDVSAFHTDKVTTMQGMFGGCASLATLDVSAFNTANVTDMWAMFGGCASLASLDLSGFDTANVTTMERMFMDCTLLKSLDVSNFNTAKVTNMFEMFGYCRTLEALDLSGFDTVNVTDMRGMFGGCSSLASLDVSGFNTANVTDMAHMFNACLPLTELDVSSFNTANVTDMGRMFKDCDALTMLDLSNFNTANVTDMTWMFYSCDNLAVIYASGRFVTSQVTEGAETFVHCKSLVGGSGTAYDENHTDYQYARIDGGASAPGYFTAKP